MNKSRAMLFSAVLVTVAFGGTAMAGTSVSFMAGAGTGVQSAVFASYLVNIPSEDPMLILPNRHIGEQHHDGSGWCHGRRVRRQLPEDG